jgi:hypothetical protein
MARMFMKIWLQYKISCKKGVHLLLVKTKKNFFQKKIMTITVFSSVSPNGRSGFFLISEFVDSLLVLKSWNRPWVRRRFLSALNTLK